MQINRYSALLDRLENYTHIVMREDYAIINGKGEEHNRLILRYKGDE